MNLCSVTVFVAWPVLIRKVAEWKESSVENVLFIITLLAVIGALVWSLCRDWTVTPEEARRRMQQRLREIERELKQHEERKK